jgi:polyisoprenoid-binding protein YceI
MSSPATQTAQLARPGRWIADGAACTVTFAVRNFGIRTVTGRLPVTGAEVTIDGNGQPARIRAELDVGGINTGHRRRDADLRGARFFGTDRWLSLRATGALDRRTAGLTAGPAFLIGHVISLSLAATFRPAPD